MPLSATLGIATGQHAGARCPRQRLGIVFAVIGDHVNVEQVSRVVKIVQALKEALYDRLFVVGWD